MSFFLKKANLFNNKYCPINQQKMKTFIVAAILALAAVASAVPYYGSYGLFGGVGYGYGLGAGPAYYKAVAPAYRTYGVPAYSSYAYSAPYYKSYAAVAPAISYAR